MQKTSIIIITNKNSWVSEPIIRKLHDSQTINLKSVIFFDARGNWKLIKKRFFQYGFRKFAQKVYFIIQNSLFGKISFGNERSNPFNLSLQTVKKRKIDYLISKNLNSSKTIEFLNNEMPDIVLVFSCSQILSKGFLSNKNIKFINFHDSLLPAHKGPSPTFWVLYNQEDITGYTIHQILPKVDSGEILYQEKMLIGNIKNEEELIFKIVMASVGKIEQVLSKIDKGDKIPFDKVELKESYEKIPSYRQRKELKKKLNARLL